MINSIATHIAAALIGVGLGLMLGHIAYEKMTKRYMDLLRKHEPNHWRVRNKRKSEKRP